MIRDTVNDFVHCSSLILRYRARWRVLRFYLLPRPTLAFLLPTSNPCPQENCHRPQETLPRSVCPIEGDVMLHVSSIALLTVSLNLATRACCTSLRLRFVGAENQHRDHWRGHGTSISK